MIAVVVIAVTL